MILGFKIEAKGKATGFVEKINSGQKIHTMRIDYNNRWRPGTIIHFATGVRTKYYKQFKEGKCISYQWVTLFPNDRRAMISNGGGKSLLDQYSMSDYQIQQLAINDGFDTVDDFWDWFSKDGDRVYKLIHWTDFRY